MGASQSTAATVPPPMSTAKTAGSPPEGCPMREGAAPPSNPAPSNPALSPLNRMPIEPQQQTAPGQTVFLPLQRTLSTIPRAAALDARAGPGGEKIAASACPVVNSSASTAAASTPSSSTTTTGGEAVKSNAWEYPSPQQFYNALVRKGWETPEESIVMMVDIHNWLNEAAWQQVRVWEEKHDGGDRSQLARFEGRPQDISPKARYHMFLGKILPSRFGYTKPFDRHDWMIYRPLPSSASSSYTAPSSTQAYTTHRYVIDYYSLPDDAAGNPVFSLDVRPAVDSPAAVKERLTEWWRVKQESWNGVGSETVGVKVQEEK